MRVVFKLRKYGNVVLTCRARCILKQSNIIRLNLAQVVRTPMICAILYQLCGHLTMPWDRAGGDELKHCGIMIELTACEYE